MNDVLNTAITASTTPVTTMQEAYASADKASLLLSAALAKCREFKEGRVTRSFSRERSRSHERLQGTVLTSLSPGEEEGDDTDAAITDDRKTFYEQAETQRLRLWERFWFSIYMIIAVAVLVAKILTSFQLADLVVLAVVFAYPWFAYPVVYYIWVTLLPTVIAWFPRSAYANLASS